MPNASLHNGRISVISIERDGSSCNRLAFPFSARGIVELHYQPRPGEQKAEPQIISEKQFRSRVVIGRGRVDLLSPLD